MRPTTDNNNNNERLTISREDYDFYTKYCLYETEENTGLTTVNETNTSKRKAIKKHNDTIGGRDRINELLICSMGVSIVLSPVLFQCSDVIGEYASNLLGNVFLIILLLSIVLLPIRMYLNEEDEKEDENNEWW